MEARLLLEGELDRASATLLQRRVADAVAERLPVVTIDASGLTFLDGAGIRSLLLCRRLVEEAGGRLAIVEPAPLIYAVLEMAHLLDMFDLPPRLALRADAGRRASRDRHGATERSRQLCEKAARLQRESRELCEQAMMQRSIIPGSGNLLPGMIRNHQNDQ
ncbi:STAS domain-containing protein [Actinoplanes couchii]|uniref:STAS domain-containing protein n=1 Tax=Actinoplanes couchii TaxID=403638 RepID=UPI0019454684|nr:STAS domain-containing protein [Actinoplanes couchii]MDR6324535.1 anti-anti-sigma factor [Actinoplanes couchii]